MRSDEVVIIEKQNGGLISVGATIAGIAIVAWTLWNSNSADTSIGDIETIRAFGVGFGVLVLGLSFRSYSRQVSVAITPVSLNVRNGDKPVKIPIDSARVLLVREEHHEYVGMRELLPDNYVPQSRAMYIEHDGKRTPVLSATGLSPEKFVQLGVDIEAKLSEARFRRDGA